MSKVALVVGGTGNIGSYTVRAFLEDGSCCKVVATSRDQGKLDKLCSDIKSSMGEEAAAKIIGIVGNPSDEADAQKMKDKVIAAVGDKIDYLVSSLGFSFHQGSRLAEATRAAFEQIFESQFYSSFGAFKAFVPLVRNAGGSYVFVSGGGPDTFLGPGTGGLTIGGSAGTALAQYAMKETAQEGFTSTQVSFQAGICPDPSVMPPGHTWLPTKDAGKALVSVAIKRKAHVKSITITNQDTMDRVIANGDD